MAKKKTEETRPKTEIPQNVEGLRPETRAVPITDTLRDNFMPYAVSVIHSRAIPEIDGFKPSHRKLLYTMYNMGLLKGRTKSANVVGQTMRLNPHGDQAIYETLVRLTRGNEALLLPYVDSKGNFGKVYSRDMAYAASRYTEVGLDKICREIFGEIDQDAVDFADNYDNTMREPTLLPTTYPNILANVNQGIAVAIASDICGFNLRELCSATVALLKNPDADILETMPAPDFSTGGEIIYDRAAMTEIYKTGRGGIKLRSKWTFNQKDNVIEVTQIPYSTSVERIIDKCAELIRDGKLKEVSDIRDETDLKGLKLAIDLKRGTDPDKLMQKLFKQTPLCDTFKVNMNVLVAGTPRTLGVSDILLEWCAWRRECVRRKLAFKIGKLREKLHLLEGLGKILLDIDRAIKIIRETELEDEVVPNLMIGFRIDQRQADYVAEIRLRNINREYLLKRTKETDALREELDDLETALRDPRRVRDMIIGDLKRVADTYSTPRRAEIISGGEIEEYDAEEHIEDYPVNVFITESGYIKKITPNSLRLSGEQKLKENDRILWQFSAQNKDEILFFTNKAQCYKARLCDFEDAKASQLGEFIAQNRGFDDGEAFLYPCLPEDYSGSLLFAFENGKAARVLLTAYDTVSNRRRLTGAYSEKSPLVSITRLDEDIELIAETTEPRAVVFHSSQLAPKVSRSAQGVGIISPKPRHKLVRVSTPEERGIINAERFRVRTLPSTGLALRAQDLQLTMNN